MIALDTDMPAVFDWATATPRQRDFWLAEHVVGWKWWAFTEKKRGMPGEGHVEGVFRKLCRPHFPNANEKRMWDEWSKETGGVFRPADGTEPVNRIEGFGEASRSAIVPAYSIGDQIEDLLRCVGRWKGEKRLCFDARLAEFFQLKPGSPPSAVLARGLRSPEKIGEAAYLAILEAA